MKTIKSGGEILQKGLTVDLDKNNYLIELIEYYNIDEEQLYENPYGTPSSSFVIIDVNGRFLLGFNKYRNQWEFPTGKIESGELAIDAAKRELYEETHQKIDELKFCGMFKIYDSIKDEYRFRAVYYGTKTELNEFVANNDDEMTDICLWEFGDKSIHIDEVDCKIAEIILKEINQLRDNLELTEEILKEEIKIYG